MLEERVYFLIKDDNLLNKGRVFKGRVLKRYQDDTMIWVDDAPKIVPVSKIERIPHEHVFSTPLQVMEKWDAILGR